MPPLLAADVTADSRWTVALLLALAACSLVIWVQTLWSAQQGRPPVAWQPRPELSANKLVWCALCLIFLLPMLLPLLRQPSGNTPTPTVQLIWTNCIFGAIQLLFCWCLAASSTRSRDDLGFGLAEITADLKSAQWGLGACLLPVYSINLLVDTLGWRSEGADHPFFIVLRQDARLSTWMLAILAAVVLAPLVEELFFRVILQGLLESALPAAVAIGTSASLFALVHWDWKAGRPDALPLLPLAMILGYVYHRRRSYPAVFLIHAGFNALNLLAASLSNAPAV